MGSIATVRFLGEDSPCAEAVVNDMGTHDAPADGVSVAVSGRDGGAVWGTGSTGEGGGIGFSRGGGGAGGCGGSTGGVNTAGNTGS